MVTAATGWACWGKNFLLRALLILRVVDSEREAGAGGGRGVNAVPVLEVAEGRPR